jgi:hypothetical protein
MHQDLQYAKEKIQAWRHQAALEAQVNVAKPKAPNWLNLNWLRPAPQRRRHA